MIVSSTGIDWTDPTIIAAILGAIAIVLGAVIAITGKRTKMLESPAGSTTSVDVSPKIVQAPSIDIIHGLDEASVGRQLGRELRPIVAELAALKTSLADKMAPSMSNDRIEQAAVEFFNEGVDLYRIGDVDGAFRKWVAATELNPEYTRAHNNLGVVLGEKGDAEGEIASCRTAIDLDPNGAIAHNNLGVALSKKRDTDEAIASFRQAIKLDPSLATAHNNLGLALQANGDTGGAIASCRMAIDLDPELAQAHYSLACALAARGDTSSALSALREAISLEPRCCGPAKASLYFENMRDAPEFRTLVCRD